MRLLLIWRGALGPSIGESLSVFGTPGAASGANEAGGGTSLPALGDIREIESAEMLLQNTRDYQRLVFLGARIRLRKNVLQSNLRTGGHGHFARATRCASFA